MPLAIVSTLLSVSIILLNVQIFVLRKRLERLEGKENDPLRSARPAR